jgi:hypothetical protein
MGSGTDDAGSFGPFTTEEYQSMLKRMADAGAGAERARVLAILDAAWSSPRLKPAARLALAIIARRVRDPSDKTDPASSEAEERARLDEQEEGAGARDERRFGR